VALTSEMKAELLALARRSIGERLKGSKPNRADMSPRPEFNQPAAVFVTLTENGQLRGCIGSMEPQSGLYDAVGIYAASAAFEDPRFSPLTQAELREIKIEVSVLSPLKKAASYLEVEPARHGVYVSKGSRNGTYLPQVWEHFTSREEFLSSLCADKAGISALAWKDGSAELFTYTVDAFEENHKS